MQDINVTLNVRDTIICKCCKKVSEKEVQVTSTSQVINLLDNFILNVISSGNSRCAVIIQNGQNVIIRNIYDYETEICIPSCGCQHFVALSCT